MHMYFVAPETLSATAFPPFGAGTRCQFHNYEASEMNDQVFCTLHLENRLPHTFPNPMRLRRVLPEFIRILLLSKEGI